MELTWESMKAFDSMILPGTSENLIKNEEIVNESTSTNNEEKQTIPVPNIVEMHDWNDTRQFNEDYDNEWVIAEQKKMAELYGGDFITVKYNNQGLVTYICEICLSEINGKKTLDFHCGGMKHLKKKNQWEKDGKPDKTGALTATPHPVPDLEEEKKKLKKKLANPAEPQKKSKTEHNGKVDRPRFDPYARPPVYPGPPRGPYPGPPRGPYPAPPHGPYGRPPHGPYARPPFGPYYHGPPHDPYPRPPREDLPPRDDPYFDHKSSKSQTYDKRADPYYRKSLSPVESRYPAAESRYSAAESRYSAAESRYPAKEKEVSLFRRKGGYGSNSPDPTRSYSRGRRSSSPHRRGDSKFKSSSFRSRSRSPRSPIRRRSPSPARPTKSLVNTPVGKLLQKLAECSVKKEDDAELALEVVGKLTKSLREFYFENDEKKLAELLMEAELKLGTVKALKAGMKLMNAGGSKFSSSDADKLFSTSAKY